MSRRRHRAGLTLVEALITVTLIGVFMVILSDLTIGLGKASVQSSQRARTLEVLQNVLDGIRRDLMLATRVVEPASGASAGRLVLERLPREEMRPSSTSARLPEPVPSAARWSAVDPAMVQTVTYQVTGGELERALTDVPPENLAQVKSLNISAREPGLYDVVLVVEEKLTDHRLKTVVHKW